MQTDVTRLLWVSAAVVCGLAAAAAETEEIRLAAGGKTEYVIVRDATADNVVRFAAWDLARVLKSVTGAEFPLVEPGAAAGKNAIEVGTAKANSLAASRLKRLGHNGSVSMSDGKTVVLVGKDAYGTVGAIYDFLEHQVGCRWFTPWGDERVPRKTELKIAPFDFSITPAFPGRWMLVHSVIAGERRNGELFAFRNCLNMNSLASFRNVDVPKGVNEPLTETRFYGNYCHSLFDFMPPDDTKRYKGSFAAHPEWYSLDGGKRVKTLQLCFSNPEMRAELTRRFLEFVAKTDGVGVFNISAMDIGGSFCMCPGCQALEKKYGTCGGPLFDYLIEIGSKLKKRHPKALLSTLIYRKGQTQRPPVGDVPAFPDNILATFAPIDVDFSKNLAHPNNADTLRDLKTWCGLVKHVWAWYYPAPYTSLPYPYAGIRRTAADVRIMLAAGLTGTGFEHDNTLKTGANFYDLQAYVLAKLFRDPTLDENQLAREYFEGVCGAAADEMYAYWDELENLRETSDARVGWNKPVRTSLTNENLIRWAKAFDRMEAKVRGNARALQRVREIRLGLDNAVLSRHGQLLAKDSGFEPARAIRDRATNTVHQAGVARNLPALQKPTANDRVRLDGLLATANVADLIPPEFKHLNPDDVRVSVAVYSGCGGKRVAAADAPIGSTVYDDRAAKNSSKDCSWWFYDDGKRKFINSGRISNADMVEGKYKIYRIGDTLRLRPETIVAAGDGYFGWKAGFVMNDLYEPGTDDEWEVYISAKFEGEKYFPGTGKPNVAAFERVILVRKNRK